MSFLFALSDAEQVKKQAKRDALVAALQEQVLERQAKKEALRAKEITAKPHPKEPLITAPKRRQRHDSQQQTPMSQNISKSEQEKEELKLINVL